MIQAYICDSTIWQARESCVEEQKPGLRIHQRFNSLISLPVRTLEAVDILLRSTVCNLTLMRRQPSCCHSAVRQEEHQRYRPGEGDQTEDDEQPPPSSDLVVNLPNGIPEHPAKYASKAITSEPYAMEQRMFGWLVPNSSNQTESRADDAFEYPEKGPEDEEGCEA